MGERSQYVTTRLTASLPAFASGVSNSQRLIRTGDKTLRDEVIRCTNRQNEMPEEALRSTDPIHRQLEQAFHSKELYYDRRKGHYRDQGKPVSQIVSVIEVLQTMLSIVLQRPDDARWRPRNYIKSTSQYNSVFANKYSPTLYLKTTEICRRVAEFLDGKDIETITSAEMYTSTSACTPVAK